MSVAKDIVRILKKLRLSGVLQTIDLRTRRAAEDTLSHQELLFRVPHDEVERRESKQLDLRMRRANFETTKTLADFDFTFNPKVPKNTPPEHAENRSRASRSSSSSRRRTAGAISNMATSKRAR